MNEDVDLEKKLLRIEDLHVVFRNRLQWFHALKGVSLSIRASEGVALIGESGSGKTLMMLSCLGLVAGSPGIVKGRVLFSNSGLTTDLLGGIERAYAFDGLSLKRHSFARKWHTDCLQRFKRIAGRTIGMIFQNPIASLDPLWSVGATLCESIGLREPKLSVAERREEAEDWLHRVRIKDPKKMLGSFPHQLSGGMCQRVMIATTLAMHPKIIIADEPTTGLDMTTKVQILALLHEAKERDGSSLLFVTHDLGLITDLTDRTLVMNRGQIIDRFPTHALQSLRFNDGKLRSNHPFSPYTKELFTNCFALGCRDV